MRLANDFMKKANKFRKQNWSAPTTMAVFIIICMIIIFSFETIGLAKKEKNLDYRHVTPEKIIKIVGEKKAQSGNSSINERYDFLLFKTRAVLNNQIKSIYMKNKEQHLEQMLKMMVNGARDQIIYENKDREILGLLLNENCLLGREGEFFDF
jgi:hypothetical protein